MSAVTRTQGGVLSTRLLLAFLVLGLVAAGLAYDQVAGEPTATAASETDQVVITPSLADPARLDSAWYCPVGSSSLGGYADHTITIANLSDEPSVASLTMITDSGPGPRQRFELEGASTQRVVLSEIQSAEVAGAVVELTGGRGAVGHSVSTEYGVAEGPCATQASSTWYFAGGRTTRDAQEYLVLMNPFPETASFNVEFQALGRSREPGPLQGAFVEARSIRIIDVNQFVRREESLAAKISTERGRLVVERLQLLNGDLGPSGAALQLGVPTPAVSWVFTAGRVHPDGDDLLTIYNPYDPQLAPTLVETDSEAEDAVTEADADADEVAADDEAEAGPTSAEGVDDGTGETTGLDDDDDGLTPLPPAEQGTTTVSVELWPSNPADVANYSVVTIEREVRPGTFVTIDLRAQAERFEFPLPYELGVLVTSNDDDLPIVAERWQFASRLLLDSLADGTASADDPVNDPEAEGTEGEEGEELPVPEIQAPELVTDLPQPIPTRGISTSRGNELFSSEWILPWVTVEGDSTLIAVASFDEASVEIRTLVDGRWVGPLRATVPAGGRNIIPLTALGGGAAVEIVADQPVSVEAVVVLPDRSLDVVPAVPTVQRP